MSPTPEEMIVEAVSAYDYPPVTYDFVKEQEHRFASVRDLEHFLQSLLLATDADSVRNGLSGVLYWGHYRAGYRDDRVAKFRSTVNDDKIRQAIHAFQTLKGTGLLGLRMLALPQFSYMAFLTKLRTFLEPERYCVLDSKVASLTSLAARLKRQPTYIPVTAQNERAYRWWIDTCASIALRAHTQPQLRPVDVERGLFYLVERGKRDIAERLLSSEA